MRIGVFDSGKGGELIAKRLEVLLPGNEWVVTNDVLNVPYGEKDQASIIELTDQAISPLLTNCDIIVIACNTATTAAISTLRQRHPDTQFVGVEPMIKPAALGSQNHHITLLATPYTLKSERYRDLKQAFGHAVVIDEPDTTGWPRLIDQSAQHAIDLSSVDGSIADGSDCIVIACTHYIDLIPTLSSRYSQVTILEPSEALARRIQQLVI